MALTVNARLGSPSTSNDAQASLALRTVTDRVGLSRKFAARFDAADGVARAERLRPGAAYALTMEVYVEL
jgi:hypothetical protein